MGCGVGAVENVFYASNWWSRLPAEVLSVASNPPNRDARGEYGSGERSCNWINWNVLYGCWASLSPTTSSRDPYSPTVPWTPLPSRPSRPPLLPSLDLMFYTYSRCIGLCIGMLLIGSAKYEHGYIIYHLPANQQACPWWSSNTGRVLLWPGVGGLQLLAVACQVRAAQQLGHGPGRSGIRLNHVISFNHGRLQLCSVCAPYRAPWHPLDWYPHGKIEQTPSLRILSSYNLFFRPPVSSALGLIFYDLTLAVPSA